MLSVIGVYICVYIELDTNRIFNFDNKYRCFVFIKSRVLYDDKN